MHTLIESPLFSKLLTLYAKAQQENAPAHMIRRLKEALDG